MPRIAAGITIGVGIFASVILLTIFTFSGWDRVAEQRRKICSGCVAGAWLETAAGDPTL